MATDRNQIRQSPSPEESAIDCYIGDDVYLENEYPECIEIHDEVQIGLRTTIIAHTRGAGTIIFGKKAFVGANCVIAASPGKTLTIGEGSVVAIASLVTSDIPPFTLYSGEKAKPIARVTVPFTNETSYEQFIRGLRPLETNRPTSPEHKESENVA